MQTEILNTVIAQMEQVFRPKAVICQINGKGYIIERLTAGWCWRNEDGDCQEDFGIAPFGTATEAQQSAMSHVTLEMLRQRRETLFEQMMDFENNVQNFKNSKTWHETVQRMNDQIRRLDYEIKVATIAARRNAA